MRQDIEASVIGGLLVSGLTPDASEVLSTLTDECFSVPLYRDIYREIKNQAITRSLIDGLMVAEAMGEGNFANVMETASKFPKAANLKGYARMVHGYHQVRQFVSLIDEAKSSIEQANSHEKALAIIAETIGKLPALASESGDIVPTHIGDLMDDYTVMLESRLKNGEQSTALRVGIDELDEITGGINPVDFVVVAARPGMGKTEFALKVSRGVAEQPYPNSDKKRGVLIFSMEMDSSQIIERQIADAGNLPVSSLRKPSRMGDEEWGRVSSGIGLLSGLDVWVVDASSLNVEKIRSIAERHKRSHPELSLIMVDYLGLIKKPTAERNDLAVAHISGSLKRMAKELKTPVLSLSQLSRDVEKRPNKRPVNADLRDSGSVEQDADSIIMLYRDAVYNPESSAAPYAEIIVTKNRFGQLGTVYQLFKNGHFLPTDQDQARETCSVKQNTSGQKRYAKGADV
ncbi:replicative DNA helicase [Pectobacterium brasiliense]|uniref:replicative DNA helicase n=1 Tax=Pectobacterium brasiliense TaxID=180957 RepID=UPI000B96616E|nr:replicative DNA helicase [Pectobacterium carotovorum]OYN49430.1 replicative DNA helicase [Pectobacterium carotovorum]